MSMDSCEYIELSWADFRDVWQLKAWLSGLLVLILFPPLTSASYFASLCTISPYVNRG